MPPSTPSNADFYDTEYNARGAIPDHPHIFARWAAQSARTRQSLRGETDLAFGALADERLDFFPAERHDAPLLVFIHGGWWRSLDKSDFSFIAAPFVAAGVSVALTNYTLAPAASIEQITLQQTKALAWLYRHADAYGFDRNRIVLAGHSAGAHLAAMMMTALWPQIDAALPPNLVKAAILMSGLYDLAPVAKAGFVAADLQLTPASILRLSPAMLPQAHPIPFFTAVGGLESDEFKRHTALIGNAWQATHAGALALPDANHLTICDAFAQPGHRLFRTALQLVTLSI